MLQLRNVKQDPQLWKVEKCEFGKNTLKAWKYRPPQKDNQL